MESIPTIESKPKAFLIGVCLDSREFEKAQRSIAELERLADTAEIEVVEKFIQNRKKIDRATYVGKGFLEEIKAKMELVGVDLIIFDNEIAPTHARNMKNDFDITALDRTEIILDIFHRHARTKEAQLEVRLAELKYQLPRLKKLWSHLDRERGASGSATGASRGMGEKQIDIDKRIVKGEIRFITQELEKIMTQKITQRKSREFTKKVCIVGYTNAGKSCLFNKLTGENVLVEDKLFATLDSTARSLDLGKGEKIIISDTVGFISNLSHNLVASFRATLRDVMDADLLLHVVDISDESCEDQIKAVNDVLKEIEAHKIPFLLVFNKIDLLGEYRVKEEVFGDKYKNSLYISALTGENIENLITVVDNKLNQSSKYDLLFPFEEQKIIANMHEYATIISREFADNGVLISAVVNKEDLYKVKKFIVQDKAE